MRLKPNRVKKETNNISTLKNPLEIFEGIFCFKKYHLLIIILLGSNVVFSQAIAEVDEPKKSFDRVEKGELVELSYVVTNIGTEPLILGKYDVECSCTSVSFNAAPVLPGKSTAIVVQFDTKTVYEYQDRIVLIHSNSSEGDIKLRFKGFVKPK